MHASLRARGCIVDIYYRASAGAVAFVSNTHTHIAGARDVTTTRFDHVTTRYIMIIVLTTGKQSAVDVRSGRVGSGQVLSMKYSPTVANPP